jgi:DNA-binding transcriptional LysR family regulator
MFDWDDLRIFLAVARAQSVGAAARGLNVDATTISRRLARLQQALDCTLFDFTGNRRRLTGPGELLLAHAEAAERAAIAAMEQVAGQASALAGHVRLSVAESVATWLLAPAMAAFADNYPGIELDLVTGLGFLSPSKREADLAVMLARPRTGHVTATRLTTFTLRLYSGHDYLGRSGTPQSLADLAAHRLIGYVPDLLTPGALDYLEPIYRGRTPELRTTSVNVLRRLIEGGCGIGMLPAFVGTASPELVEILPDEARIVREFWLVAHDDSRTLPRIKVVTDLLTSCLRDLR